MTLVVWNPNAGRTGLGERPRSAGEVAELLRRHGVESDVREAADEDEARRLAREARAAGAPLVVAAGGDGTVGVVAGELLGSGTALGVVPLGTIMNVARMLGLPREPDGAAAALAAGRVRSIDVGTANGRLFLETGSVGMNAAMFREAQRFGDGAWSSIVRTIWVAFRYRPARMSIELDDGVVRTRALMVTVSNGPYTGAGMTVAPSARLDDGRFDVRVFRRFSKVELVRHLLSIAFGRRRYAPQVKTYRSRHVRITSAHPLPCRADSQDLGTTPVEFVTCPAALQVVVGTDGDAGPVPTG